MGGTWVTQIAKSVMYDFVLPISRKPKLDFLFHNNEASKPEEHPGNRATQRKKRKGPTHEFKFNLVSSEIYFVKLLINILSISRMLTVI